MKVLVVGSGGREHALVWKLSQSQMIEKIYVAPGNAGMKNIATCVPISAEDIDQLLNFAIQENIDLTVVGPEKPLTLGIVDRFQEKDKVCFGPNQAAAELEGSKAFSKNLMSKYGIPTAAYDVFTDIDQAKAFLKEISIPCVIKADGLAAGKGVIICDDLEQAEKTVEDMLSGNSLGEAGHRIVIEEFLEGQEVSVLAFSDGKTVLPMVSAQDHKRIFDYDQGPNTGGMGAYTPAPMYTNDIAEDVFKTIIQPTIDAMDKEGRTFVGILYTGLMLTKNGPKVLEYNVRFGDPETQPVLMRLESDFCDIILKSINGNLDNISLQWKDEAAVCVVLAAENYPNIPKKGDVINGLEIELDDNSMIFHAGTKEEDGEIVTNGGRVLGVTALGKNIEIAMEKAYKVIAHIDFDGMQYRHDIGSKALRWE